MMNVDSVLPNTQEDGNKTGDINCVSLNKLRERIPVELLGPCLTFALNANFPIQMFKIYPLTHGSLLN